MFFGFLAGAGLIGVYLLVMIWGTGSTGEALDQLLRLKYWVSALVLGFSLQVGLYSYLRQCAKSLKLEGGVAATSATTSTVAMIACCAHHLTDLLPIFGLTVLATVLSRYQEWFLSLGILSNLFGILYMSYQIRKAK
ncbi:MAG: hypothetical protein Q8Q15_01145 [bacterium]|nr:hypothetical protein [bacterium]